MFRTPSIARLGPLLLAALSSPARGQCSRELLPAGLQNGDRFGYAVATSGELAAVVATYAGTQGEVAVHRLPSGEQLAAIAWWDAPGAVGLDGTVLAVGMLGQTLTYGQAALYDAATGTLLGALSSSGSTLGDFFGSAIALEGDHVLVGAPVDPLGGWPGAAYVFDTTTRAQRFELTPSDGAPWNGFGFAVDVDGDLGAVGNPYDDEPGANSGSAYLFDLSTGQELRKVTLGGATQLEWFGAAVALEGPLLFAGAPGAGLVVAFDVATGAERYRLSGTGGFGHALAAHGDRLVVSAPWDGAGVVRVYEATTGMPLGELTLPGATTGDVHGWAVAAGPGGAVVGAPQWGYAAPGRALLHPLVSPRVVLACDPAQPNSTGIPATFAARACGTVDWNDLRLDARAMPLHQLGLFLVGDASDLVHGPGGSQGDLCVGGDVRRYFDQVQSTGPDGTLALQVDLARLPGGGAIQAGETWHFQAWYRDHAKSNFTPAAAVTFP